MDYSGSFVGVRDSYVYLQWEGEGWTWVGGSNCRGRGECVGGGIYKPFWLSFLWDTRI